MIAMDCGEIVKVKTIAFNSLVSFIYFSFSLSLRMNPYFPLSIGTLAATTATATKTSPEDKTLVYLCYFAIISTRSNSTE